MRWYRVFWLMVFSLSLTGCLTLSIDGPVTSEPEEESPVTLEQVSQVVGTVMGLLESGPLEDPHLDMESTLLADGELRLLVEFEGYPAGSCSYDGFIEQTLVLDGEDLLTVLIIMSIDTGSFCLDIDAMYDIRLAEYSYFSSLVDGRRAYERELSGLLALGQMP